MKRTALIEEGDRIDQLQLDEGIEQPDRLPAFEDLDLAFLCVEEFTIEEDV